MIILGRVTGCVRRHRKVTSSSIRPGSRGHLVAVAQSSEWMRSRALAVECRGKTSRQQQILATSPVSLSLAILTALGASRARLFGAFAAHRAHCHGARLRPCCLFARDSPLHSGLSHKLCAFQLVSFSPVGFVIFTPFCQTNETSRNSRNNWNAPASISNCEFDYRPRPSYSIRIARVTSKWRFSAIKSISDSFIALLVRLSIAHLLELNDRAKCLRPVGFTQFNVFSLLSVDFIDSRRGKAKFLFWWSRWFPVLIVNADLCHFSFSCKKSIVTFSTIKNKQNKHVLIQKFENNILKSRL